MIKHKNYNIGKLIIQHYSKDKYFGSDQNWPDVVMVDEEFYLKVYKNNSVYYEIADRNKMIKWFYPRLRLLNLINEEDK